MPTFDETRITHFAKGADNPETVQTGPDGKVYCCGFVGQIYRVDLETGEADQYATIDGARIEFDDGWGLLRASNTSPVLVMRCEAETRKRLNEIKKLIEGVVSGLK